MRQDKYDAALLKVPVGTPDWKEVETMILSTPFQQIYQQVVLASEARLLALAHADLSTPQGQHAATQTQGLVMGMRLALDMFISMSEQKENADG